MIGRLLSDFADNVIPENVFSDLRFSSILPESTLSVLAGLPGADEIKRRQELFSLLENPEYSTRFSDARRELDLLRDEYKRYKLREGILTRALSRVLVAEKYLTCLERLTELHGCGLTDRISSNAADILPERRSAVSEFVSDTREKLSRSSEFVLTFSSETTLTRAEDPGYLTELREYETKLGLEPLADTGPRLGSEKTLEDAVTRLFPDFAGKVTDNDPRISFLEAEVDELAGLIREFDFFLNLAELSKKAREKGIPVCFPEISSEHEFTAEKLFDVTLIDSGRIVPNDAELSDRYRFSFVVGANGGGKTTFLRAVGVNLILFLGGAPIFAEKAEIYPFRKLFTHFPADELSISTGRFVDECQRADAITDTADAESFVLINEAFAGTNDSLGSERALEMAGKLTQKGASGLFVTHFAGVAYTKDFGLLRAMVDGESNERTFRVVKSRPGEGSYALDILKKYRLDSDSLERRGETREI